jgi:hypothetical protein
VLTGQVHQHDVPADTFHDRADRLAPDGTDDEVAVRKTEAGPGGSVWLRSPCALVARLSGVPWLLIEICARSLGDECISGVFYGPL